MTFVVIRWAQFASTLLLFGLAAFTRYGIIAEDAAQQFLRRARITLVVAAGLALVSALAWLAYEAAAMSGRPAGAWDPATLRAVLTETEFGRVWTVRLGLAALTLAFVAAARRGRRASWPAILSAGALLVTLCGTGHAADATGGAGTIRRIEDAVHLASAGIWAGGLVGVALLLGSARIGAAAARGVLVATGRFSAASLPLIACIAATGVLNAVPLVGRWSALVQTPYGRLLCAKVAFFALALGVAAYNRYVLLRRLRDADAAPAEHATWGRTVWLEQALVQGAILAVSIFGTLSPPIDLPFA